MPDPGFTLAPGTNNWMQDFAWDRHSSRRAYRRSAVKVTCGFDRADDRRELRPWNLHSHRPLRGRLQDQYARRALKITFGTPQSRVMSISWHKVFRRAAMSSRMRRTSSKGCPIGSATGQSIYRRPG